MLKNFLKKYFLILKVRNRFSASVQIGQRRLFHYYSDRAGAGNPVPLHEAGFRVFSQFEEDGILLAIFSAIGMDVRTFVEIGSDDGINSNCANLAFHFGWHGLFIDANAINIRRGRRFYSKYPHPWMHQSKFHCAHVTPENINNILTAYGMTGDTGLLSIDIDGDDYWIWNAIGVIQPRVVVIETHIRFGMHNIVVPYGKGTPSNHGASPVAMVKLGQKKGYRLVGANLLGFNFIFLREDLGKDLYPEVSIQSVLQHPSAQSGMAEFHLHDPDGYVTPIP